MAVVFILEILATLCVAYIFLPSIISLVPCLIIIEDLHGYETGWTGENVNIKQIKKVHKRIKSPIIIL